MAWEWAGLAPLYRPESWWVGAGPRRKLHAAAWARNAPAMRKAAPGPAANLHAPSPWSRPAPHAMTPYTHAHPALRPGLLQEGEEGYNTSGHALGAVEGREGEQSIRVRFRLTDASQAGNEKGEARCVAAPPLGWGGGAGPGA